MAVELPTINSVQCTACGDCVAVCPTNCLALTTREAWLPRPADCIACMVCMWICPTEAITMGEVGPAEHPAKN